MNKTIKPSNAEWERLFRAAAAFRQMAPWKWMQDEELFGVKNPESGEIGYCCVLGYLQEVFALVVYDGREGYAGHLRMSSGEIEPGHPHLIEYQRALIASFENRGDLTPEDRVIARSLGLEFRGRKVWPQYRHYQPGYVPWYLTATQARFLATVLEQAVDILPRYKNNADLFPPEGEERHLVRVSVADEEGLLWHDEFLPAPEQVEEEDLSHLPVDEVGIERIKKKKKASDGEWEIGYFYMPTPIDERKGERPYLPRAMMILDRRSGMILDMHLEGVTEHRRMFRNNFMNFLETGVTLPSRIFIDHKEAAAILAPISDRLKISLHLVNELESFNEAYHALVDDYLRK